MMILIMPPRAITTDYFENLRLHSPQPTQGGAYIANLALVNEGGLHVQLPKCSTRRGILTTQSSRYADLCFEAAANQELIDWVLELENKCVDLVFEKRRTWFTEEMSRDDIEAMASPVARMYRGGANVLLRVTVPRAKRTSATTCVVYNQDQEEIGLEAITSDSEIIPLVAVAGVKFTTRSIEIELKLVQAMLLTAEPSVSEQCLITLPGTEQVKTDHDTAGSEASAQEDQPAQTEALTPAGSAPEETTSEGRSSPMQELKQKQEPESPIEPESEEATVVTEAVELPSETTQHTEVETQPICTDDEGAVVSESDDQDSELREVEVSNPGEGHVELLDPQEVYANLYKAARARAKTFKKRAIQAAMEAARIKREIGEKDWALIDSSESEDEAFDTS